MNWGEFKPPLQHLVDLLRPPGWNEERESAFFTHFANWDARRWARACSRAASECDRFPSPKQLSALVTEDAQRGKTWTLRGCGGCEDGMIRFEVERHGGQRYDRYAACTCEAGDKVAAHMVQMARAKGRNNVTEGDARYRTPEPPPWVDDYREQEATA